MQSRRTLRSLAALLGCLAAALVIAPTASAGNYWGYTKYVIGSTVRADSSYVSVTTGGLSRGVYPVTIKGTIRDRATDGRCARLRVRVFGYAGAVVVDKAFNECDGRYRTLSYVAGARSKPTVAEVRVGTTQCDYCYTASSKML